MLKPQASDASSENWGDWGPDGIREVKDECSWSADAQPKHWQDWDWRPVILHLQTLGILVIRVARSILVLGGNFSQDELHSAMDA